MPRCVSSASASSAESQYVNGSVASVAPKPRSSHVMQRNSPASAATCAANISWSMRKPWLRSTAGPSPPESSK